MRTGDPVAVLPAEEHLPRRRFSVGGPFCRGEWAALAGVAAVYGLLVLLAVRRGPPLGWDESVYALRAREFGAGAEAGLYWRPYRAPGLPWMGGLWMPEGHEVLALRLLVAAFGLLLVIVTWLLARHLFGRTAGLVAAAGTALTPPLLLAATQVWPDVPGACLGLAAIALFVFATGGDRPSWWMLGVPVMVALATLVRFGAPLPICLGLLAVGWWRRRVLLTHPPPVLVTALTSTAAVVLVLAVPWVNGSGASPLGAIGELADRPFAGFPYYVQSMGEVVGPAAIVVGLVGLIAALVPSARPQTDRGAVFTAAGVGLVTAVVIAAVLHGEVRYLAPAYPWLWVAAAPGLVGLSRHLPRAWPWLAAGVLALGLAAAAVGAVQDRNADSKQKLAPVLTDAHEINARAGGQPCVVVTGRVPQLSWYTGCEGRPFDLQGVTLPAPVDRALFMVLLAGDRRQPEGGLLAGYLTAAGPPVAVVDGIRDVSIYRVGVSTAGG